VRSSIGGRGTLYSGLFVLLKHKLFLPHKRLFLLLQTSLRIVAYDGPWVRPNLLLKAISSGLDMS